MNEQAHPPSESRWRASGRRWLNVLFPLLIATAMLGTAIPGKLFPRGREGHYAWRDELMRAIDLPRRHDDLAKAMRTISISQRWKMYAPDPTRGHSYLVVIAHDAQGNEWELPESRLAREGWGTAWVWNRGREDIWHHVITRRFGKVNRNRTWYMRGICVREARAGHPLTRVELRRVFRRVRSPEKVLAGKKPLGPKKTKTSHDASCGVKIIREMIADDQARRGEG